MSRLFIIIFLITQFAIGLAQTPGDKIFNSSIIHEVRITVSTKNYWDSLTYYKELRDTTDITNYMKAKLEFD